PYTTLFRSQCVQWLERLEPFAKRFKERKMSELTVVGKPVTRVDVNEKITGQAIYGYDLVLPNMLYGKVLFSPKAHAKIKRINTVKAKQYPGVVAVVTGEDAPWTHGESIKDKPFLAQEKVRYIGEPVAAVAAE